MRVQVIFTAKEIQKLYKMSKTNENDRILVEIDNLTGPEYKYAVPFEKFKKDPAIKVERISETTNSDLIKHLLNRGPKGE